MPPKTTTPTRAGEPTPDETAPLAAPASSTASSDASETFFADPGPEFDPDAAGELPEHEQPVAPEPAAIAGWEEAVVVNLLAAKGMALHTLIGKGESDWIYQPLELRAVAPPLTRILNRIPAAAAAAGSGDELALMIALAGYVGRSVQERSAAIAALQEDEPEQRGAPVFDPRPPDAERGSVIPTLGGSLS